MADIKTLAQMDAVSGNEGELRKYLLKKCEGYRTETDAIGNLYVYADGKKHDKTALVTAYMDEAGIIISKVTDKGFLKFKPVGDIDPRVIVSKKIRIGENKIPGIIGMKAIHLQKKSEREKTVAINELYIDIGAKSQKEALERVNLGDYASFDTEAGNIGDFIKGKAMDRAGVLCVLKAMETEREYDTVFVFTAQKHVGSRGAKAITTQADIVLNVGAVETGDMFGSAKHEQSARLGGGAVVGYADKFFLADRNFADKLISKAKENNISVQCKNSGFGQGEAGAVQTGFGGREAITVDVPVRCMNTPVSLVCEKDIDAAAEILKIFLKDMGEFTDGITK